MRRRQRSGFRVGGDRRDRRMATFGAAVSLALTLAARAVDERTFGIYDEDGTQVGRVQRREDGIITVTEVRL